MEPLTDIFMKKCKIISESFNSRNINCFYYDQAEEAVDKILSLIEPGKTIGFGGSKTIIDCGLVDILRDGRYDLIDRYKPDLTKDQVFEMRVKSLTCDVFITGTNAITMDGRLVNIDGIGNRVAAMTFGPKKVIVVAGKNKITEDVDSAITRIREVAAPVNAVRLGVNTPCSKMGVCDEKACFPPDRLCGTISVIECQPVKDRLYVILINKNYGY